MRFRSVRLKIAFWGGLAMLLVSAGIVGFSSYHAYNSAISDSISKVKSLTNLQAAEFGKRLGKVMESTSTLAQAFSAVKNEAYAFELERPHLGGLIREVLEKNPDYFGVWTCWEPNAFDGLDEIYQDHEHSDASGRLISYFRRHGEEIVQLPLIDYENAETLPDGSRRGDFYLLVKEQLRPQILEPTIKKLNEKDDALIVTLVSPIMVGDKFFGAVGAEIRVDSLHAAAKSFQAFGGHATFALMSNRGQLAATNSAELEIGKLPYALHPDLDDDLVALQKGESWTEFMDDRLDSYLPFKVDNAPATWTANIVIPSKVIYEGVARSVALQLIPGLVMALVGITMLWFVGGTIARPISQAAELAGYVRDGVLTARLEVTSHDEVGELGQALNDMAEGLRQKEQLAVAIAAGNLSRRVTLSSDKDELGKALGKMTDQLNELVAGIRQTSGYINDSSAELSDSSQTLSKNSTEQAASLEEITSTVTEIGGQSKQNAENALEAALLVKQLDSSASIGNQRMRELNEAMTEITESGMQISKFVKVIDDIAFQTNLLALNAAVEAARAGSHGKGFAVVANEVRNLATRSAKAALETTGLIEESTKKTKHGATITNQTAKVLQEIVEGISKIIVLVTEISDASNDQAAAVTEVGQGMHQLESVTQQNAANAQETASASTELKRLATELHQTLALFKLSEVDSHESTAPSRPWDPTQPRSQEHQKRPSPAAALPPSSSDFSATAKDTLGVGDEINIVLNDKEWGKY